MGKILPVPDWVRPPQFIVGLATVLLCGFALLHGHNSLQTQPEQSDAVSRKVLTESARADCAATACLALTFDDGPKKDVTPRVLDILKRHGARATFFVLGSHVRGNEALLRRMHAEGHEIGNHTWSHFNLTKMPPEQVRSEVMLTQAVISGAGVPAPQTFRAPYGALNETAKAHIPLSIVGWNIDPEDWNKEKQPHIIEHMASHAKPGGVVVLHDTQPTAPDMLEPLITKLKAHYQLVTVSELLNLTPGQRGIYYSR